MKHNRHYDALTTSERFTLTIEAMARMDLVEIDRLQEAMEKRTYRMSDAGYWRSLQIITTLALRHAYMRKETTAHILLALILILLFEGEKDTGNLAQAAGKLMGKLKAIDDAWEGFCHSISINPDTALQSAQIEQCDEIDGLLTEAFDNVDEPNIEPNEALREHLKSLYAELWEKAASTGH